MRRDVVRRPIVKVFNDSGCRSYLLGCPTTGQALLVDPKAGRGETYRAALGDFGLKLKAVLDTHTHADHLSGSLPFIRQNVPLNMGAQTGCRRPLLRRGEGDVIEIGELAFTVREVPGHTDDSIALFGHGILVTGDTLLIGSLARADFRGSVPAELFESVQKLISGVDDSTVVLPGHDYQDILLSTVGVEREKNPALKFIDGQAYADHIGVVEGAGNTPDVDHMLALNLEESPEIPEEPATVAACCAPGGATQEGPRPTEMTPDELTPDLESICAGGGWFDVRDRHEFEESRIPNTRNIPLGEIGFHLGEFEDCSPLVFSCLRGVRSLTAARTVTYLGAGKEPVSMSGGFMRWCDEGRTVDSRIWEPG